MTKNRRLSIRQLRRRHRIREAFSVAYHVVSDVLTDRDLKGLPRVELLEVAKKRTQGVCSNPMLVLVIVQLLPILIEWFMKWREANKATPPSMPTMQQLMSTMADDVSEQLTGLDAPEVNPSVAIMSIAKRCHTRAETLAMEGGLNPNQYGYGADAADWMRLIAALLKIFANFLDWVNDE